MSKNMSEIAEFYTDKTIFLTGGTGFIGQIIIEKLLRCCDVKEIYLLIRGKNGKSWQSRVQEILSDPVSVTMRIFFLFLY